MKNKIIISVIIIINLFISEKIYGQGLKIGVYTEPQLTWITSDEVNVISDGNTLKLNTGIEFNAYFMPNYAITLGVSLNNQGGKITYDSSTILRQEEQNLIIPSGITVKHNYQYVGIPLGLKLKTEEIGYTTIYFHSGAIPMFTMKATASSSQFSILKENIDPEINMFNLNYFFELGLEYRLAGNTAIIGGVKWSAGFNDVTKSDDANNNLNSAALHIGILF